MDPITPFLTAPVTSCMVYNNNTANGAACGQILSAIISKATTPLTYWAYGATAGIIVLGLALPVTIWKMGPLGRRLWGWGGDLAAMVFPNGTAEIYKVQNAFSSWLKIRAKRVSGLIRSGKDSSYPITGTSHTLHVVEAASMTSMNDGVVVYTQALDEVTDGRREFEGEGPGVIPSNLDEAVLQYFMERIRAGGNETNLAKLKANYQQRYRDEIPADVLVILGGTGNPLESLAKAGGDQLRRFKELVVDLAANDRKPLWPVKGIGLDARSIFRWSSSQDHPIDFKVAYDSGYEDGKADQKVDDKKALWVILGILAAGTIIILAGIFH